MNPATPHERTLSTIPMATPGGALNRAFYTPAVRRQPIRPFIQPSQTTIEKVIDYIVGDGPSNRYQFYFAFWAIED